MENYITALHNYITENQATDACPNMVSLLDILFCCYNQNNRLNTAAITQQFQQLDDIVRILPIQQQDKVIDLACDICVEHQRKAFREGVLVGFRLYEELQKRK